MLGKIKKVGLGVAAVSGAAVGGAAVAGAANSDPGTTAVIAPRPVPSSRTSKPSYRRAVATASTIDGSSSTTRILPLPFASSTSRTFARLAVKFLGRRRESHVSAPP